MLLHPSLSLSLGPGDLEVVDVSCIKARLAICKIEPAAITALMLKDVLLCAAGR